MEFNPPERLDNGMEVLINSRPHLHYVGVCVGIRYGPIYEDLRINGSAHFLEHMLFEGTKTKAPGEIDKLMRENHFGNNAFTDTELTAYHICAPKSNPENAVAFLADMTQNSVLGQKEVENQRGAIVNEILGYQDDPKSFLGDIAQTIIFEGQPAGRLCAGTPETVSKITRDDLVDIYRKNYTPKNMVLSIYGAIKTEDAERFAKKYFSDFQGHYHETEIPDSDGPSAEKSKIFKRKGIEQVNYTRCFGFPGSRKMMRSNPNDIASTEVLMVFLDQRLDDSIRENAHISDVTSVAGRVDYTHGVIGIFSGASAKKIGRIQDIITSEIDKARTGDITPEDLEMAKSKYINRIEMDLDNALSSAVGSATWQTVHRRQLYDIYHLARGLSIEDITSAAERYLNSKKSVSLTLEPEDK